MVPGPGVARHGGWGVPGVGSGTLGWRVGPGQAVLSAPRQCRRLRGAQSLRPLSGDRTQGRVGGVGVSPPLLAE